MNTDAPLSAHPAPKRRAKRLRESFFALFGGPIAWFVQLNLGYGLASQPCFRDGERTLAPRWFPDWTWAAMIALMILACAIALLAALVSWRAYARTEEEAAGDHRHVLEVGSGRTRFLALWGVVLGAGAAFATLLTAVAFFVLPRCAG
jgi:hypothetical protein